MPYWRRRQLRRQRRHNVRPPDDHDWTLIFSPGKHDRAQSKFTIPSEHLPPGTILPLWLIASVLSGGQTEVTINMNFDITGVDNVRRCRRCGQESTDGKMPPISCKMHLVKQVMES